MSAVLKERVEETFDHFEQNRVAGLKELARTLSDVRPDDRGAFSAIVAKCLPLLEVDVDAFASSLGVDRSTVSRWARGISAPHRLGRVSVYSEFARLTDAKLKYHRSTLFAQVA
jgi:hypothetical protein